MENIKNKILKENFSNNYSGFSISFQQEINEFCKLNLQICEATKTLSNNEKQNGIIIKANFEQDVNEENTIDIIFNTDYNKLIESNVNTIF